MKSIFINEKVFNDCIHGPIQLPPAILAIVDTAQFQRLRYIKQTGTCDLVFPNATHNRFQHSIGVGHLARKFAEELRRRHPDWVDEKDILCVMMAGICHDLGHGPFSHLWEDFIKEAGEQDFHHEDLSIAMFEFLLQENALRPKLEKLAGLNENDILFVKEMIAGPICEKTGLPDHNASLDDGWPYRGRDESKSFLYEIVANKETGIDVDKWDYILRDDQYFNIGHVFNYQRFISYSQVCEVHYENGKGELRVRRRICLRDKEAENLVHMWCDRTQLHSFGYQHRISEVADRMLKDAWLIVKDEVKVNGKDGKLRNIVEACKEKDMVAFSKLTDDYIYFKIMEDANPKFKEAQEILGRLDQRQFYLDVCELSSTDYPILANKSENDVKNMLLEFKKNESDEETNILRNQIVVIKKLPVPNDKKIKGFFYNKDKSEQGMMKCFDSPRLNSWKRESFFIFCKDGEERDIILRLVGKLLSKI